MRKDVFVFVVSALVAMWLFCPVAKAEMLVQHLGSTDPETEGWALTGSASTVMQIGPLEPDPGYENAWKIDDNTTSNRLYYRDDLSTEQQTALDWPNVSWQLDTRLRVTGTDRFDDRGPTVHFVTPGTSTGAGKDFIMDFGVDADGNPIVQLNGLGGTDSVTLDSGGYHDYSLRYDAASATAALYIDDSTTAALSGYAGDAKNGGFNAFSFVRFGTVSTGAIGGANLSLVQLSIVPEPSTVTLLGLGVLAFAVSFGWRSRKTRG